MSKKTPVTIAYGDGIGPEIMPAALQIMTEAGAQIEPEVIEVGEKLYLSGNSSGIAPSAWDSLRRTQLLFKAPITTPLGGGYKSLNVTIRKTLGLYANIRPCVSYAPAIPTKHPKMDVVIVRENEEDLYAGIEYRQTDELYHAVKVASHAGTEKIIRYAFEYARAYGRKKISCMSKDNILKLTDGLFHKKFEQIAKNYPDIATDHWIIDIGTAMIADKPDSFDMIVTTNLYGDVISDVAAQITGSVGLGASANIGDHCAMFEAIHGSAPNIAGKNMANPSGLLLSGALMLVHIGQGEVAERIHNAWLSTIEEGLHTGDIFVEGKSRQKLGTKEFTAEVLKRLGQKPQTLPAVSYAGAQKPIHIPSPKLMGPAKKELLGVDVYIHWRGSNANDLAAKMQSCDSDALKLQMITSRGVKVWPDGNPETFTIDHWRCRFYAANNGTINHADIIALLQKAQAQNLDFIKIENLVSFDGEKGFSLGQGQ